MVVCKALNSLNPSFSPFLLPHYPLATLGVLLFLRKARPSPAPGSLHLCFLCLEHDLLRYPHSSPFSSFRSIFTCHLCREPSLTPLFKTEYKCPFQFLLYFIIKAHCIFKDFVFYQSTYILSLEYMGFCFIHVFFWGLKQDCIHNSCHKYLFMT